MTNFEKIKSMTIRELTDFLKWIIEENVECEMCPYYETSQCIGYFDCEEQGIHIDEWLLKECVKFEYE